jgi:hypothetical protein
LLIFVSGRVAGGCHFEGDVARSRTVADVCSAEVGTAEVGTDEIGTAEVGMSEVGTAEVGTAEVGTAEVGAVEDGTVEVGAAEDGIAEVGTDEVGFAEIGTAEVDTDEVGAAEVGIAEVGTPEVDLAEVGNVLTLLSPLIPLADAVRSVLEQSDSFVAVHGVGWPQQNPRAGALLPGGDPSPGTRPGMSGGAVEHAPISPV